MKNSTILLLLTMFLALAGYSQKIKQISGNLTPLKGQKTINLEYSYDGVLVGDMKESDYINKKVSEYNSKEPGKGDTWKVAWANDRKTRYQPKFEELFNKYLGEVGMIAKPGATDAQYTILVKTLMIEPGFNVGVVRRPAMIEADIMLMETANPGKVLSQSTVTRVPGSDVMGFDFDSAGESQKHMQNLVKLMQNI
ncbi:MAG: hypothetical protein HXX13_03760 [Bacteroidetes bacterium]|nr:hypothetical protein [Bacteroidota bacterium]